MGDMKKSGPAASFGSRYGTVVRKRYIDIVTQLRRRHECPRCHFKTVTRLSVGIWHCGKCGLRFSGGAYVPTTKLGEIARRAIKAGPTPLEAPAAETVAEALKEEKPRRKIARKKAKKEEKPEAAKKEPGKKEKKPRRAKKAAAAE